MANLDDEDPTRGARVELAFHYARKGDAAEALGIVAGLSRDLRDALLPIVKALLLNSDSGFGRTARCDQCGRPLTQGSVNERPAPPQDSPYLVRGETTHRSSEQRVVLPFPDVRPHLEADGQSQAQPQPQPQPQAQSHVHAHAHVQTPVSSGGKGRRADVSLALGLVAMSAYLLWRLTGPLRATRIGSVSLLLGTEASVALITGSTWLVLVATRSWGANRLSNRPLEPSPRVPDVRDAGSDHTEGRRDESGGQAGRTA